MSKWQILLGIGLTVAGCQWVPGTTAYKVEQGKGLAAQELRDPDSAKFRNLIYYENNSVVCGEINGKNAYGAYTGFRRFYVQDRIAKVEQTPRIENTKSDKIINDLNSAIFAYNIFCKS